MQLAKNSTGNIWQLEICWDRSVAFVFLPNRESEVCLIYILTLKQNSHNDVQIEMTIIFSYITTHACLHFVYRSFVFNHMDSFKYICWLNSTGHLATHFPAVWSLWDSSAPLQSHRSDGFTGGLQTESWHPLWSTTLPSEFFVHNRLT